MVDVLSDGMAHAIAMLIAVVLGPTVGFVCRLGLVALVAGGAAVVAMVLGWGRGTC